MSFTDLNYHIVWSTKGRRDLIHSEDLPRIREYIGGIIKGQKSHMYGVQWNRKPCSPGDQHTRLGVRSKLCPCREDQCIKMDSRNVSADEEHVLAGWIFGFQCVEIGVAQSDRVRPKSAGASSDDDVSGRVDSTFRKARHRL